ncbi:flagellar hook-length control protein FliK [Mesobacillus foraminis]|uniref:flagellar hook-length control protein FliK n=1 Tax=Mesobacillus foraminis TaxID=279826 RepID=UPI0039A026F5
MQVGNLSSLQAALVPKQSVTASPDGNFSGSLAALNLPIPSASGQESLNIPQSVTMEDLEGLLEFLLEKDLPELEAAGLPFQRQEGTEFLVPSETKTQNETLGTEQGISSVGSVNNGLLSSDTAELFKQVLSVLGLFADDFNEVLEKDAEAVQVSINEELSNLLAGYLSQQMNSKTPDEWINKLSMSDAQFVKAVKLYSHIIQEPEKLYGKKDSKLEQVLLDFSDRLAKIVKGETHNPRLAYIQNRFTPLVGEINLISKNNQQISQQEKEQPAKPDILPGATFTVGLVQRTLPFSLTSVDKGALVSAEQLIKQFESVLSRASFHTVNGTQKLTIKLFPEHLGSVRVELIQKDDAMIARILTSSSTTKEVLESQVSSLRQAFASQGIGIERIEIAQQQPVQQERFTRDFQQQHGKQEKHETERDRENNSKETDASFEEILLNTEM